MADIDVMFEPVAGLEVATASVAVYVRTPGAHRATRHTEVRTLKATTESPRLLREWLVAQGVQVAAMESTSMYRKSVFNWRSCAALWTETCR